MKKYLVLIIIALFILSGCGGESPNGEIDESINEEPIDEVTPTEPVLTQERENTVRSHIAFYEDMISIYELEKSNGTIVIWLNIGDEPMAGDAARGITDGIAMEIAELFDFEISVKVTAIQLSEDDAVTEYGSSIFSPETGEVEYQSSN